MMDAMRRLKILCSFGGSILPRPFDGKLRYVGGETRIVSLPRDVRYVDLMSRMREIFDGALVLKYQQPDEDLDALVSVMNDDDVVNMMEEYDKKIGEGEEGGCVVVARLRIFLFSHLDDHMSASISSPRFDADEARETERRYLDALNSVPDGGTDGFNEQVTFDDGMDFHGHQFINLNQLKIPRVPSNGSFYSPGHSTPREQQGREFSGSPSSARFYGGMNEFGDNEFLRQSQSNVNSPFGDTGGVSGFVWVPPGVGVGVGEKSGFPGNLGHDHGSWSDGNNICEHCHMAMQRNQGAVGETLRYHEIRNIREPCKPLVENLGFGIDFGGHSSSSCVECLREREMYLLNQEMKMDHGGYSIEQIEHRSFYGDIHGHDRDWILRNQYSSHRHGNEMSGHRSVQYEMEDSGRNFPYIGGNSYNSGLHVPSDYIGRDDHQYIHSSNEQGNKMYHDQRVIGTGPRFHGSSLEDGSLSIHTPRKTHGSLHPFPSYESPGMMHRTNSSLSVGSNRPVQDEVPIPAHVGINNQFQSPWMGNTVNLPQQILPINDTAVPEQCHIKATKVSSDVLIKDNWHVARDSNDNGVASASSVSNASPSCYSHINAVATTGRIEVTSDSNGLKYEEEKHNLVTSDKTNVTCPNEKEENFTEPFSALPEAFDYVKKVALECTEAVTTGAEVSNFDVADHEKNENTLHGFILKNDPTSDSDDGSDDVKPIISKIEPTLAEEEALDKGLQTIKDGDLEEISKLGIGTYGAVYHGKWRGADIAIKRIKASCFSGTPSERERLIADFWKEASILSSLHHPNVVSFYGVVRDGPDGSLATATEFMINGSLKQFLRKKDRTIDRRKRLSLAMDASFGMEYLHVKNIVHFDLKCENLLVNMRDPHRPVCKIGDLGLSKVKQHTLVSGGVRGTLPWMAPELLSGKTNMVTEKIDVYSFGIVMWELLTGEDPYADMNGASIIGEIVNNSLRPQVPSWCDPEWKSLMESCWVTNPGERPSFSAISQKLREMSAVINKK